MLKAGMVELENRCMKRVSNSRLKKWSMIMAYESFAESEGSGKAPSGALVFL